MNLPGVEAVAQVAVGRVVNSLPESLLIVFSAALLLRLSGRRSSGTCFAVWMVAFMAVAVLPFLGLEGSDSGAGLAATSLHPAFTIPTFWAELFLFLWLPVMLLALARVIAGLLWVRRIRATSTEVDLAQAHPLLRETMQQHAARRPVCLATSDQVRVPTAIGFRRPAVVLPPWVLRDLSPEQLRPILIHELAHLARRDDWTNLLQKAVRAVFCYHPAVWWIDSRLSRERELACDDAVLVATADPRAYASSLLGLLEKSGFRRGWSMAQAAIGRAREATQRITRILNAAGPATTRISRPALGLAATLSAACCGLLLASPRLVVFGPAKPSAPTHAQIMSRLEPEMPRPETAKPMVVSAAWHPDAVPAGKRVAHTVAKPHHESSAHARTSMADAALRVTRVKGWGLEGHSPEGPAPMMELARAQTGSSAAHQSKSAQAGPVQTSLLQTSLVQTSAMQRERVPMLLVFETTSTRVDRPAAALPASTGPTARAQAAPATRIETVQFIERRDASGVQIQIIQLLVIAPAQLGSISHSI
jgi:beta-lactamase regulating signal transducer with metallopeptidase domain